MKNTDVRSNISLVLRSRIKEILGRVTSRGSYGGACMVAHLLRRLSIKAEALKDHWGRAKVQIKPGPLGSLSLTIKQSLNGKFTCIEHSDRYAAPRSARTNLDGLFGYILDRRDDWTQQGLVKKEAEVPLF